MNRSSKKPAPAGLASGLSITVRIVADHISVRGTTIPGSPAVMLDEQQYALGINTICDKLLAVTRFVKYIPIHLHNLHNNTCWLPGYLLTAGNNYDWDGKMNRSGWQTGLFAARLIANTHRHGLLTGSCVLLDLQR